MEKKEYVNVKELREIASDAGIKNVARKREDDLLAELEENGIAAEKVSKQEPKTSEVDEKTEDEATVEKDDEVEGEAEEETVEEEPSDKPEEKPSEQEDLEKLMAEKAAEIQALREQVKEKTAELTELSKKRQVLEQASLATCVKEFQESMKGSEAIKQAQARASIRRHAEKIAKRRERMRNK